MWRSLSFANVMSVLALFVALGGGAYAVSLDKNSVGTKQLKNGAVKTKKMATDAVTSAQVRDGSLRSTDFGAGQVPAGPQGPQGEPGSALAFAHIGTGKSFDAANSKNIEFLGTGVAGLHCFNVTTPQVPRSATATLEVSGAGGVTDGIWVSVTPATVTFNCGGLPTADVMVGTANAGGTAADRPFYLVIN